MLTIGPQVPATTTRPGLFERRPEPANATVTYNPVQDCYDYEAPGYHHQVSRLNAFKEGASLAAVVGVPSLVGAAESALIGAGASTLLSLVLSPTAGAVIGAVMMGRAAYKATRGNPIYTGLAALAGAGVGTVAWPVLKLPGVVGGLTGAIVATGIAGGAAAARAVVHNQREDEIAREHGYLHP